MILVPFLVSGMMASHRLPAVSVPGLRRGAVVRTTLLLFDVPAGRTDRHALPVPAYLTTDVDHALALDQRLAATAVADHVDLHPSPPHVLTLGWTGWTPQAAHQHQPCRHHLPRRIGHVNLLQTRTQPEAHP